MSSQPKHVKESQTSDAPQPASELRAARSSLAHFSHLAMLFAGTPVNPLIRYWKYVVFGTLLPGVALAIVAAPKLVWEEYPDPFWKMVGVLAGILCGVGLLMWFFLAFGTLGSDVTKLWKRSKRGAVLTFMAIVLLARVLQRFTGRHFYG